MPDPLITTDAPTRPSGRKRWTQWVLVTSLIVAAAGWWTIIAPYRQTQAARVQLERHGAQVTTAPRGPEWLQLIDVFELLQSIDEIQLREMPPSALSDGELVNDLQDLQRVFVFEADLTGADMVLLKRLHRLQLFSLSHGQLDPQALNQLAALESLRGLYLHQTNLDDTGLSQLARLESLETLAVTDAPISDAGLASLHALQKLQTLNLGHTQVTDAGVQAFQEAVPNCAVFYR